MRTSTVAAATVALLMLGGCGAPPTKTPAAPRVEVARPLARQVVEYDEYTARLEAVESVELRARVSGHLEAIRFRDGAMVEKGEVLFIIDTKPYEAVLRAAQADLSMARARLDLAQKHLSRGETLIRSNAVSREELEIRSSQVQQEQAALAQAQAAVDAAELDVGYTNITAPITGRVGRREVTEGNLVIGGTGGSGTLLARIVSVNPIYAYFETDERSYLEYVHLGLTGERPNSRDSRHPVWIGLADEQGFPRQGFMDFVDNRLDPGTGTMVARAVLPNADLVLVPGLFARLRLPGSGQYAAVSVPDEAVASDQSQQFVYVVDGDGKAQYRAVQTGPLLDGLRVVKAGLTVEDRVVVRGLQRIRPGQTVDAHEAPASLASAAP